MPSFEMPPTLMMHEGALYVKDSGGRMIYALDPSGPSVKWKRVAELWQELAAVSPAGELVAEGRIVYAGALADQDRMPEALATLRKRGATVTNPSAHHLRLWYALGDLEERAGNLATARDLFDRVRRADPAFADVAERRAALA